MSERKGMDRIERGIEVESTGRLPSARDVELVVETNNSATELSGIEEFDMEVGDTGVAVGPGATESISVGQITYEGSFFMTHGGESNVEAPPWYHEKQGEPDGHVACPECDAWPLNWEYSRNVEWEGSPITREYEAYAEHPALTLYCDKCGWHWGADMDEAKDALGLLLRATGRK